MGIFSPRAATRGIGAPDAIRYAAAPAFALMALATALGGGGPRGLCGGLDPSPLGGMTLMYALMGVAHLPPWLTAVSGLKRADRSAPPAR